MPFEQSDDSESDVIKLIKQRLSGFETEQGRLKGLSYQPRTNDVVITTSPKVRGTSKQVVSLFFFVVF
jgi:hypothetical protein